MIDIFSMLIFERKLKQYAKKNKNMKEDYKFLLDTLEKNPTSATPIKDEIFKIRLKNSSSNRGKSSGYRIYYFYKNDMNAIVLLYMYSKNEESNLSTEKLDKIVSDCKIIFKDNIFQIKTKGTL